MNEEARQYILDLFAIVSTDSILIITPSGQLKRLKCPFKVICRVTVSNLARGKQYAVEAVKMTLRLEEVFIIQGKAYHVWYFTIVE